MSINVTLLIQMVVFFVVVLITMKYIWPVILGAMNEREKQIADGLAASDEADIALKKAQSEAEVIVNEAKDQAGSVRESANKMASKIKDQAKADAIAEKERQLAAAVAEIEQESNRARENLRKQVSTIALAGTEKLLSKEVDSKVHADLLDDLVKEI
ncbi:MAG: F0F1 ATP synthase subunit B [Marinicellaceae bacterium]